LIFIDFPRGDFKANYWANSAGQGGMRCIITRFDGRIQKGVKGAKGVKGVKGVFRVIWRAD